MSAVRAWLVGLVLAGAALSLSPPGASAQSAEAGAAPKKKKEKKAKRGEGVRDSTQRGETREKRGKSDKPDKPEPLFAATDPIAFTLVADFRQAFRVRDTLDAPETPATLRYADSAGREVAIPVRIAPRGHFRVQARNCSFPPLRVRFDRDRVKGTLFAGQRSLKLGTHCQGARDYEQIPIREHLIYRAYNLLTERSFRSRLARATYVDVRDSLKPTVRWALWIESEHGLGRRNGATVSPMRGAMFADVDGLTMATVGLFEYLIGNTDFSLYALHNIRVMQAKDGDVYPVAYDFDFSGLADTRYATPDPRLPIKTVKERLFRGPCATAEQLAPALERFRARRAAILALYDSMPPLDRGYARWAKEYIGEFYATIDRPRDLKGAVEAACPGKGTV